MSAIGPGDWVECVDNRGAEELAVGAVFAIEWVSPGGDGCGLQGVEPPRPWLGYAVRRFRPIYSPKSELIETLLRKANRPVKEDA